MNLLKDLYNKFETLKGAKLYLTLIAVFTVFLIIGVAIGYFRYTKLNNNELTDNEKSLNQLTAQKTSEYEGKVSFINPNFYPDDKISFVLQGSDGNDIILLRSKDQKLSIAEGLHVKLTGTVVKTKDGKKEILIVDKVMIKNATN
jgi:uncharacterized protein YneF (UPF0154 family)